jgi:aminoglycoside phosphotransferase (APT) family kinase protein
MPGALAGLMARLHDVPPDAAGADDGVGRVLADIDRDDVHEWLRAHRPVPAPPVICHGDLHGANLLFDGNAVTVLDWELACCAPREYDVARTALILALLPGVPRAARRLLAWTARRSARSFVAEYVRRHPIDRDALRWFDVAHSARLLAVARRSGNVADLWRPLVGALDARVGAATGLVSGGGRR